MGLFLNLFHKQKNCLICENVIRERGKNGHLIWKRYLFSSFNRFPFFFLSRIRDLAWVCIGRSHRDRYMFSSSHIFVFWLLVFSSIYFRDFLSAFFSLAHLALQNVTKDYVIFLYFRNFIAKSDQKPKTKIGMNKACHIFVAFSEYAIFT